MSRQGWAHGSGSRWPPHSNTCTLFCYQTFGQGRCENTVHSIVLKLLKHEEPCVQLYLNSSKVIVLLCCESIPLDQSRFWGRSTTVLSCLWRADNSDPSHCVTVAMGMASTEIPIVSFIPVPQGQPSALPCPSETEGMPSMLVVSPNE